MYRREQYKNKCLLNNKLNIEFGNVLSMLLIINETNKTHLSINFNHGFAMAWVNFVPAVGAKTDPKMKI